MKHQRILSILIAVAMLFVGVVSISALTASAEDFAIQLDGKTSDWTAEQKANVLKGWYDDEEGRTRGLEYMAFTDANYVYLYTRTITASNADKGLDIIFNKDQDRLATGLWFEAPGENVVDYYFAPNVALENGLYETVSEIVLNKAPFVNKNGNVYLGVWFIGCDDGFAPLSWHEDGKTTIWGLNHRCPWNVAMSHQKVTENGFDHYHYLDENGVCGWCQEKITFPITVDGDCSDWSQGVLNTAKTADDGKNRIYAVAYTDDENLYIYIELTQHTNSIPNYINVFAKNSQTDGIRTSESFAQYYDDWNPLRPWCQGSWACAYYADCDDGYTARAMRKITDADGNPVACLEMVINKELAAAADGSVKIEVQIDDVATWSSGQSLSGWALIGVTENGFAHDHAYGEDHLCTICGAQDPDYVPDDPTPDDPTPDDPTPDDPTPDDPNPGPDTGDNTALFIVLAITALLGAVAVAAKKVTMKE